MAVERDGTVRDAKGIDAPLELGALAATLRHDLRTPLNQIIGYAEMLEEDAPDDLRADLGKIHGAARNMLASIDHGLDRLVQAAGAAPLQTPAGKATLAVVVQGEGAAPGGPDVEAERSTGHLLVVDDNEMNSDMLAKRLSKRGFRVDIASDGAIALTMIDQQPYDAVLLDVMMPGISGLDVLRRVRKTRSSTDLPIIMATARDGNDDIVEALKLGANDYVKKPIDLPVLLARVDAHLSLKRSTEEIRRLADQLSLRNRFIQSVFGRYMSDQIVEKLLAAPDALTMGGELRTVTVMMSDLRGFSSLSERLDPSTVIALLNDYLARMTEIIYAHGGTIDEFIGDAILVLFGAPLVKETDAARAVSCAVEMQRAMGTINENNRERGLPELQMGIGINTGEVVVGNIGSERRAKYGVVGRNVNLASRIEAFTVGGQILISDATLHAAGAADAGVVLRRSLEVFPKGSKEPMVVHEVGGVGGEHAAFLGGKEEALRKLPAPLPVTLVVLDGVHVRAEPQPAAIVQLSPQRAALEVKVGPLDVPKLSTVRLIFDGVEGSDTYAKVLDTTGVLLVHFTSIAPSASAIIAKHAEGSREET
jgi:class 3 adenylate cyclase/CheY-like chemotaxis protein